MVILGLDLSKNNTAYCIYNDEENTFDYGEINTEKLKGDFDKITTICNFLSGLIKDHKVNVVTFEKEKLTPSLEFRFTYNKIIGGVYRIVDENGVKIGEMKSSFFIKEIMGVGNYTLLETFRYVAKKHINIGDIVNKGKGKNNHIYRAICVAIAFSLGEKNKNGK